jgi:hypothetical protein
VSLEDLENLIGTFTAIKEGSTTIENAFPPVLPKEHKKVEKPDFGFGEPAPLEATTGAAEPSDESAAADVAPEKRERKLRSDAGHPRGPRHIKPTEMPTGPTSPSQGPAPQEPITESPQQEGLRAALRECNYDESDFLAGLKLIEFSGVQSDVELIEELSEKTCQAILETGVEGLMGDIRDYRWMKGMK